MRSADAEPNGSGAFKGHDCYRLYRVADRSGASPRRSTSSLGIQLADAPKFDAEIAALMIGKCVLVGLTYQNRRGDEISVQQFYGTVASADERRGTSLILSGQDAGQTKWLPPGTDSFHAASKGEYRLRSSGEVVVDPDYTAIWAVVVPDA
jgi:hypothetical protein